ncbi:LRR_RI domain-containing protein [Naegleria gruberi]|uniref:LRR_RI domain-containing protein n=1 Tax=Naegleria gruberi TaxID=5762 RepID=D2VUJ0_NAEGR|nr:LRR_RI domain-containing protein [Naegleria gruberi]EFC39458.1 LRR_RI domain-containing protein [Naegleria gruberi]|eukprot:XP_002672202.1 LRR_RI domain-containing protein [Naegleria gruberi strain NEG-M]
MVYIHDDCLFHILTFVPSLDLLKNCLLVSKQFQENARRVSFTLDFSANLRMRNYGISLKDDSEKKADNNCLIRFNVEDLLSCQYLERLESLNLSFNNFGSYGAKLIAESKYLMNLRELILNGCTIHGEGLDYLLNNVELVSKLTGLGLARCCLTDKAIQKLANNKSNLENLKYLDLEYNHIEMIEFTNLIRNLPCNLKELNVSHCGLNCDQYILQGDSIPELSLEALNLSFTAILDEHLEVLCNKLKKLKTLHLVRVSVDGSFKKIVLDKLPQLTYLDISNVNATSILSDLRSCEKLKTLIMDRCRLKTFDQFQDSNYLSGIETLSLMDNVFNESVVLTIAQTAKKRGINLNIDVSISSGHRKNYRKILTNLVDNKVSKINPKFEIEDGLSDILSKFESITFKSRVPSLINSCEYLRNVTIIDLYDNELGDEGFRNLFTNNVMHNLRKLLLGYNAIKEIPSPEECHSNLKSLTHLDLKYNLLGDNGLIQLVKNPHLSNLRILDLEINGITKEGIKYLVESPHMSNLNSLNLDGAGGGDSKNHGIQQNKIGDEGFEMLLNSNLNNLLDLCVSYNELGNESAKVLANHKGAKNLVEIIMFENTFNDEAIPYLTSPAIFKLHTLRVLYSEISPEGILQVLASPAFSGLSYSI